MRELQRRLGFARSYGLDGAELLTLAETAEAIPLLDPPRSWGLPRPRTASRRP